MKKYRLINAAVWLMVAAALIAYVTYTWYNLGAGFYSLFAAVVFYSVMPALWCYGVDCLIKAKNK